MATIVTRSGKGSPLTNTEVDSNFTNLNTDKLELSGGTMTGNLSLGDNDKAIFGAGSDLQIYHDGTHSIIKDAGAGYLKLGLSDQGTAIQNTAGTNLLVTDATDVSLRHNGDEKLATTATGIDVTGVITTDGLNTSADINFGDNDKAIFGAGSDLQISHDGSHSKIQDVGTGDLKIQATNLLLEAQDGTNYIYAVDGTAVRLYHPDTTNGIKLATTATGIDVTGTVNADTLDVTGSTGTLARFRDSSNGIIDIKTTGTANSDPMQIDVNNRNLELSTNGTTRFQVAGNGDITFYETDGTTASFVYNADAGTTFNEAGSDRDFRVESDASANMLVVDGAENKVGINRVPNISNSKLEVGGADNVPIFNVEASGVTGGMGIGASGLQFFHGSSSKLAIASSGAATFSSSVSAVNYTIPSTANIFESSNNLYIQTQTTGTGIVLNSRTGFLTFQNNGATAVQFGTSATLFNEAGADVDFRVESDTNTHMLFVDAGANHVNIGTATDLSGVLNVDGNIALSGNGTGNRNIFLGGETDSYAGSLIIQAGGVSAAYGGGIRLYGHSHASKSGDVVLGISSGSGGSFRVNSTGVDTGIDRLEVTETGAFTTTPAAGNHAVFNESGVNADFRVESNGETHALFVDAGNDAVHIGGSTDVDDHPLVVHANTNANAIAIRGRSDDIGEITFYENDATTKMGGLQYRSTFTRLDNRANGATLDFATGASLTESASFSSTQNIFNDGGVDMDFRVESDGKTHMLFVDSGTNRVGINQSAPGFVLDVGESTAGNLVAARLQNKDTTSGSGVGLRLQNTAFGGTNEGEIRYTNNGANNNNNMSFHGEIAGTNGLVQLGAFEGGGGQWVTQRGAVFNESGINSDFRVESDNIANALFVDASADNVGIMMNGPTSTLHVHGNKSFVWNASGIDNVATATIGSRTSTDGSNSFAVSGTTHNTYYPTSWVVDSSHDGVTNTTFFDLTAYGVKFGGWTGVMRLNTSQGTIVHEALRMRNTEAVFNEGSNDTDFRVESNNDTHMLFVDAGADQVKINTTSNAAPSAVDLVVGGGIHASYASDIAMSYQAGNYQNYYKGMSGKNPYNDVGRGLHIFNYDNDSDAGINFWSGSSESSSLYSIANFNAGATGEVVFNDSGLDRDFRVESDNNTHMLFVDAENDRVKIGSSTGSAHFNVVIADSATNPLLGLFQQQTDGQDARVQINVQANDGGDPYMKFDAGGSNMIVGLHWKGTTNNELRMGAAEKPSDTIKGITVTGSGNVYASSTGYASQLDSSDTGKTGHALNALGSHVMQRNANSTGSETMIINNIHSSGASIGVLQYRTRNSVEGSINGTSSGIAITNNSDYRKKENITDATGCLTKITGLRPVTYTHRSEYDTDTTTVHTGFIAHEVSDHLPSIVNGTKDAVNEDGNVALQSVAYADHEMIANLVGAIKELEARIVVLENA